MNGDTTSNATGAKSFAAS
jgi:hypothetical protein